MQEKVITYNDVFSDCLAKVTKQPLLQFGPDLIDEFRKQIGTLLDNLSHVYRRGTLPGEIC